MSRQVRFHGIKQGLSTLETSTSLIISFDTLNSPMGSHASRTTVYFVPDSLVFNRHNMTVPNRSWKVGSKHQIIWDTKGLEIPFEPVRSGLFYSLRLGGTWVAADYWIHYFSANSCTHTIRLEHLEEDSNRYVLPLLPKRTKPLRFPNQNTNQYSRKIEDFFSKSDLKRIYENNPIWIAWEEKTYGNLTTIIPTSRLISKASKFFRLN